MPVLTCLREKLWTGLISVGDQVPTRPVFTRAKIKSRFGIIVNFASQLLIGNTLSCLRSAVLVVIGLECWWCVRRDVYWTSGPWTLHVWLQLLLIADYVSFACVLNDHICIARVTACVQKCIFISRLCCFTETSSNNILPLSYKKYGYLYIIYRT